MLNDRRARTAYVATKVAVLLVAAALTWPLARAVGPKAWVGLGVFAAVLTLVTFIALVSTGRSGISGRPVHTESVDHEPDDIDPDQPVELPVEDSIDLHSFPPRDIPDVVEAYLEAAVEKGFTEIRLIHGRGIGVQRDRVQKLLARHHLVAGFHDAPPQRGGWGATVAYLKSPKR